MSFTSSETALANQALAHMGVGKVIANMDSEPSREAVSARIFYETARDEVLRDFAWPFATRIGALALVSTNPVSDWGYAYRQPSGCLMFRRIISGSVPETRQSRVPYKIAADEQGILIYCNLENAEGEWTIRSTAVEFYPPDFKTCLAYKLASFMVPMLSAGDPFKLSDSLLAKYKIQLMKAAANARNEEQQMEQPQSEFIRIRDGATSFDGQSPWQSIPPVTT